ncbi:tripartite tricarboxylate transporter permease [Nanoarchaeota archaeon]
MLQYAIAILAGILSGIVTGLTPGIHINLVSLIVVSTAAFLLNYFSLISLACFIIAMSVTHSFLDAIPGIYLGAPSAEQVLGVLPGHRYLLQGNGLMALKLTLIGSFGALVLSTLMFPAFLLLVKYGYPLIRDYIGYFLVVIVIFMILTDRKPIWALFVFLTSGSLGYVVLNFPRLENPLFPLLSGLFGIATLALSLNRNEKIPDQKTSNLIQIDIWKGIKALFSGQFSGFLTAVLPGVGASMAAVISVQFTRNLGDHGFMVLLGSVNTVNFIMSMATFYVLDKARNGSIIAVQKLLGGIDIPLIIIFLACALIAGSISVYLALKIAVMFGVLVNKVNYTILVMCVIILLLGLTLFLSKLLGLMIVIISTAVGVIPAIVKVKRTHAMGCLMLPVMLYFLL